MPYVLGIDLGTSSVKVAVVDTDRMYAIGVTTVEYPVYQPHIGFVEQAPSDWWNATINATVDVLRKTNHPKIAAIGLSGQMHGIVCLNEALQPIQNSIIWADARSAKEAQDLSNRQSGFAATLPGSPAVGFAASSALWLKTHQPEILEQTYQWCLPKDYIRLMLTGKVATDPSDAASSWLFDISTQTWAGDVYEYCGLRPSQMPPILSSSGVHGTLQQTSADLLGLPGGVPVVTGSADLPAQALAQGITEPDTALITVGTGGQIFVPLHDPILDENLRYYLLNHNLSNTWYVQAAILSAGLSLRWLRDILGFKSRDNAYDHLSSMANSVPQGANGLLFLPYLSGERSPHLDPQASGLFFGLRLHHTPSHLARAVMEGVAFALRDCFASVPNQQIQKYVLSGGITQSSVWPQILADVLGQSLNITVGDEPHGCIGAAILAALGTGIYQSVDEVQAIQEHHQSIITGNPSEVYEDRFVQYRRLYDLLKDEMHHLHTATDY